MVNYFLQALWFLAPAGIANMIPVGAAKLFPKLNYPMDFYLSFNGKRLFGEHKTLRGLVTGVIFSICAVYIQQYFYEGSEVIKNISLFNYENVNATFLGTLMGLGALIGDAVKSFAKRQINISPGKVWFPFDQIDWILGTVIFTFPVIPLSLIMIAILIIFGLALHLFGKFLGYVLKINEHPI